ncbi:MAG: protein translocase subunit SecD [Actinomycetota bacterium]
MKPRRLWASVLFVLVLVGASVGSWFLGSRPVLGLDLEGGVSVILTAPEATPPDVMARALENIRRRVDAFGTAEPQLFTSGTSIEVQIPGLARGTVEPRTVERYCLRNAEGAGYGCQDSEENAQTVLEGAAVTPIVQSICLTGEVWGDTPPCFGTEQEATDAVAAITVEARSSAASPTPTPTGAAEGPAPVERFCLAGTSLAEEPCFDTRDEAQAALDAIAPGEPTQQFCLQQGGATLEGDAGTACFATEEAADTELAALTIEPQTREFCVVSSAGRDLGCFPTEDAATARLQETGQERLLEVIGTTARLEQREVLQTILPGDPSYAATPVTCGTEAERGTEACTIEALAEQEVVFPGPGENPTKYKLGPLLVTGDAIKRATAVYSAGSTGGLAGWQIDFTLTSEGTETFADVTTRLVNRQLAIIVDDVVISAPTVEGAITGGSGVISGSFTEARAKDLATQLNAGALPVALTTEQVLTVSPTLGKESLRQGLLASVAGLVALALYLFFYYRLLGLVAWVGMTIWAVLAFALVSAAGSAIGFSLTLAGVAGLVISLGVTADSYIVFFERLKDEIRAGRSPRSAVQPAFRRAYRTIVAADVVTALAAIILYLTAISSVRGFALSLGVATALDLFVVWFFKRPTVFLIARSDRLVNLRGFGLTSAAAADPLPGEAG